MITLTIILLSTPFIVYYVLEVNKAQKEHEKLTRRLLQVMDLTDIKLEKVLKK